MNQVPDRKTPLLDPATGLINQLWYDFFSRSSSFSSSGAGTLSGTSRSTAVSTSINSTDFSILGSPAAATNINVTLPIATGSGRVLFVKKVNAGTGTITIVPNGTDLIEGGANILVQGRNVGFLIQDGAAANWYIISSLLLLTG